MRRLAEMTAHGDARLVRGGRPELQTEQVPTRSPRPSQAFLRLLVVKRNNNRC
jgi:hypothetical protein